MSLNYATYVSEIATLTVISSTILVSGDNNFSGIMPGIIDYAEGRIYRDLDLPAVRVTDISVICSSGVRTIALSTTQGTLLVIETMNLFSSAGTTSSNGTRIPLVPVSKAVVDTVYPSALSSNTGLPTYFARVTDTEIMLGPTPDQPYGTEVIGTTRPPPLSATNSTTWLSLNTPELLVSAGMIFASGHMRNFGAQSDDPKMAASWEQQYTTLLKSQSVDTLRMKFEAEGWSQDLPSPIASPPRV